ncbi:hypothetical protein LTR05_002035 [Lithohypha guttulata]|uniref:GYF domain-containing protein n=1 Tax=Lithohypha guttulata TaxID=1690604 RepID=A0AAN7Y7S1_9EURO|nr:hypothetical protein LTR05_002035 [Lithohypha guttulata]
MQSAKRSAEDFARVHHEAFDTDHSSKKPCFDVRNPSALAPDELEDDAVLDADVIGARGQQVKRGAVNVDGYDSDSDNENFDARAAAKAKAQKDADRKTKEEEQDDMFAELEEEFNKDGDDSEGDTERKGGGKRKSVKFLDEDQIEGQVKNSKSGGHVSADFSLNGSARKHGKGKDIDQEQESSSDSEVDDVMRADAGDLDEELGAGGKKKHAPKLDAFNMREENEEGKFDEQGNYVRKAVDPDAKHDIWLEGISKKEMKKAQDAHEKREKERRQKTIEDDAKSDEDVLRNLLPLLQPSETILEALARLNRGHKKKPKWQNKSKKKSTNGEADAAVDETDNKDEERTKTIDSITEAADLLLSRGQPEIYDAEREMLIRQYQRLTGEIWKDPDTEPPENQQQDLVTDSAYWQYRWSDARDGGDSHGPYDTNTMKAWSDAGYFGDGVEFRKVGEDWTRIPDFV